MVELLVQVLFWECEKIACSILWEAFWAPQGAPAHRWDALPTDHHAFGGKALHQQAEEDKIYIFLYYTITYPQTLF